MSLDYAALGFKAGLEIHQQLDTPKLFCRCPTRLDEDDAVDVRFVRKLHPTASELGEVDPAAIEEARKALTFEYVGSRETCCLVEMDEEPPHAMSPEALDVALETTLLLEGKPVDEVHIMRKIVVDGSNTSGFQRTSLVATSGTVRSDNGDVGIQSLCLEEDSARRLDRTGSVQRYRLDRLGIPLIEIATDPDIKNGAHAREVAETIGLALRATEKVKRGIGTIRQDLNVSIAEGARVEIKGVQELRLIEPAVDWEVRRQVHLLGIRRELKGRGAKPADYLREATDVTDLFAKSDAKLVQAALGRKETVQAVALPRLAGLIGAKGDANEEMPPPRVGREFADYAKVKAGVKGIFQSDELPAYGLTQEEVDAVRDRLSLQENDAFALVVAPAAVAKIALEAVAHRAAQLLDGVPEETRDLNLDGTSRYLRPLPGGARMYPETDVPPIRLDPATIERIRGMLPEMPAEKTERFLRDYPDLGEEQTRQLIRGGDAGRFERLVKETGLVKEAARLLLSTIPEAADQGADTTRVDEAMLVELLAAVKEGAFAKEAMPRVLTHMANEGVDAAAAADALGLGAVDMAEVEAAVDAAIAQNADLVRKQGLRAQGPLMGPLMGRYRGKVSGKDLSAALQKRLKAWLDENA